MSVKRIELLTFRFSVWRSTTELHWQIKKRCKITSWLKNKIFINKKIFQFKIISWSILYRGKVPRIKIAVVTKKIILKNIYDYKK